MTFWAPPLLLSALLCFCFVRNFMSTPLYFLTNSLQMPALGVKSLWFSNEFTIPYGCMTDDQVALFEKMKPSSVTCILAKKGQTRTLKKAKDDLGTHLDQFHGSNIVHFDSFGVKIRSLYTLLRTSSAVDSSFWGADTIPGSLKPLNRDWDRDRDSAYP